MVRFFATLWLKVKKARSRSKAQAVPLSTLPDLGTPQAIASYVTSKLQYTGDPILGGLDDFYQHPEYLQYCIEHSIFPSVDCDDYSVLAYALAKKSTNLNPEMVVFLVKDFKTILRITLKAFCQLKVPYYPFHEGCFISTDDGLFLIDTNGLWPLQSKDEVLQRFNAAWGVEFVIMKTEYPFS